MLDGVYSKKAFVFHKIISSLIALVFTTGVLLPPAGAQYIAELPKPGEMVLLSPQFEPVVLKGLSIHPENPLAFDFIADRGEVTLSDDNFKQEADKLIKYFLTAMTIPEDKSWVNLSPTESDRIIPDLLAQTEMGKQMLEQDYLLKQLAASLTNPDTELGKKYWDEVHRLERLDARRWTLERTASDQRQATNLFSRIWIVPQTAVVLEKDGHAFISESHLKVMMADEIEKMLDAGRSTLEKKSTSNLQRPTSNVSSDIFRSTILPVIEKEVNEGKNFAPVRQIYNSVILATWYKISLKETLLTKVYADKGKIKGIEIAERDVKQKVYDQYLEAFRRGVYNIIKEDYDAASQDVLPRKYFSGGFTTASSQVIEIRKGDVPAVGSSTLKLVRGMYAENIPEVDNVKSFYTTRDGRGIPDSGPDQRFAETFKPLESKNKLTMPFEDGEVTLAYDQSNDTTYLVQIANDKLITQMMIPGKLTDTSVIFDAFNTAQDLRNWVNKNSALSLKLSFDQQGLFNLVLAKALLAVDEDIDFNRNPQVSNILGLMEYLVGPVAVSELNAAMSRATPAERQRILDKELSQALAQNPEFIINAAQLLGIETKNPQLTISKVIDGGTIINSYNPETDLSIFIIRRGLDQSVYVAQGNIAPILQVTDTFKTAEKLDAFLRDIKTSRNTDSGFESPNGGYILDGEYALAVAKAQQIRENNPEMARVIPAPLPLREEPNVLQSSFSGKAVSRLSVFAQRLSNLPQVLNSKILSGVMNFLKRHSLSSLGVREVKKANGVIRVSYDPALDKTTFVLQPSRDNPDTKFTESRYVFLGDLTNLPIDNEDLTGGEVQNLLKIGEYNNFEKQTRIKLLQTLFAAQLLKVGEFEISSEGQFSLRFQEIVEKINSKNSLLKERMYLAMRMARTDHARKKVFVENFLYLLFEDLDHEAFVETHSKPPMSFASAGPRTNEKLIPEVPILSKDSSQSVELPGGNIKISQKRGLLQVEIISENKPVKNYFVVVRGVDAQTLAQKISKVNNSTGQPITAEEFQRVLDLANNSRFDIFERGYIFQILLAAAQLSRQQLERIGAILINDPEKIKADIPKIARALRVNFTSITRSDGKMEILYNPFNRQSQITIEYKYISGKVEKTEYSLQGDWTNYSLDSYRSVKEIQTQMAAVAQSKGLSETQQQNLLRIVDAARTIKLGEFHGHNSPRIKRILELKSENNENFLKGARKFFVFDMGTAMPRERQGYFVEFLVSQLSLHPQFFGAVAGELGVNLLEDKQAPAAVASTATADVGGIDFNPTFLNLQIKRDNRGVPLPLPQQNLDQINIEGLYPVILNIAPVTAENSPFLVSARKN